MEGLKFFVTLFVFTLIIAVLLYFIWKKHRNWTVVFGIGMIYYWSLSGAWFIVFDQLTSDSGEKIGLHYYYYFEKLFHIILNKDYLFSIAAYGLFIICIEVMLLIFPSRLPNENTKTEPVWISHLSLILIALSALAASIFFNYEKIIEAIQLKESIYVYTRLHPGTYFTLHQLCNEISVLTLLMGIAIMISGKDAGFVKGKWSLGIFIFYLISFSIVTLYLVILGNRHDLILGGLIGLYLLYYNLKKKIQPVRYLGFLLMIAIPIFTTDTVRSFPWGEYLGNVTSSKPVKKEITEAPTSELVSGTTLMQNIAFSNEMFAAHMSMYGAIHFNIPHTNGSSLISLTASFIPRMFWPNRPMDIYPYYASGVNYHDEQGFTIHHATGWYLNFGWLGIIIGGFLFGSLWSYSLTAETNSSRENRFAKILVFLLPISVAAFIPLFIRAGIEVYKPLLIEGILIPALILWLAAVFLKYFKIKIT